MTPDPITNLVQRDRRRSRDVHRVDAIRHRNASGVSDSNVQQVSNPEEVRGVKVMSEINEQLMSVDELAEFLGTGPGLVRGLVANRRIEFVKVGKFVRFRESAVLAYIDSAVVPAVNRDEVA